MAVNSPDFIKSVSNKDIMNYIRERGNIMEHDIPFNSLFMGSPILISDQWIGYFDGIRLLIFNVSLDNNIAISDKLVAEVFNFHNKQFNNFQYFEVFGDFETTLHENGQWFNIQGSYDSGEHNKGIGIDFSNYNFESDCKRHKHIRKLKRNNYTTEIIRDHQIRKDEIGLINTFVKTHQLEAFDIAYTINFISFFQNEYILRIHCYCEGRLVGLATLSIFLKNVAVFVHTFVDRDFRFASDALYLAVIEYCLQNNIELLDMGYSMHKGLLDYKLSWGANKIRGSIKGKYCSKNELGNNEYYHWLPDSLTKII